VRGCKIDISLKLHKKRVAITQRSIVVIIYGFLLEVVRENIVENLWFCECWVTPKTLFFKKMGCSID
jgi:hypothetical protein